ncbi:hypothetical protein VCRA2121O391_410006 [Vibrio crassostreae]|nr:hypothetical protein VCRA2113O356_410027 [Vibrio crassostreae]CAK2122837.1 hypothetical protein VCRA2117O378_440027 [Vibrio crassostreae]CAK2366073.1 hypothetical protein VCRA2119O386_420006 [Vibrio crassostreae]CAK2598098.1 hypothetical protein VCRA2126O86_120035 [Vibrio crassostreae]CAK2599661.1 hypothetical protein VCRA2127O91_120035 [Vibrio crassostreae]
MKIVSSFYEVLIFRLRSHKLIYTLFKGCNYKIMPRASFTEKISMSNAHEHIDLVYS